MVEQTQVQRVESILKRIRELKREDEKRAATGEFFNVFLVSNAPRRKYNTSVPSNEAHHPFIPVITSPRSK